jgi:DMSO/TMAO reductase YedYZ molybdopterin-dependent catalytic subunit
MKKSIVIIAIISMLLLMVSCSAGGGASSPVAGGSQAVASLAPVEVKQYQGKNLSAMSDVKDNAIAGTQHIDVSTYKLAVDGLVNTPQQLTYDDVLKLDHYQKVVTLNCVEGWNADILWEGVLISDIINKAGAQAGANTVIFHGSDEYTTSLPLDYIQKNKILLAYKMNDVVIPPEKGFPFMVVAEDKLGYKWAKWIVRIELSSDPNYKGYWESRGYDNDANV